MSSAANSVSDGRRIVPAIEKVIAHRSGPRIRQNRINEHTRSFLSVAERMVLGKKFQLFRKTQQVALRMTRRRDLPRHSIPSANAAKGVGYRRSHANLNKGVAVRGTTLGGHGFLREERKREVQRGTHQPCPANAVQLNLLPKLNELRNHNMSDTREAFEAHMFSTGMVWDNSREEDVDGDDQYADVETRLNWGVWQAAQQAALAATSAEPVMMDGLLPCPHCGAIAQVTEGTGPFFDRVQVECSACRIATFWMEEGVARRQWNRRVAAPLTREAATVPLTDEQIAHLWDCSEREGETIMDGYAREIRFAHALLTAAPAASPAVEAATVPEGWALVPVHQDIDAAIRGLYRRFKDWSKRGFGPEDVTWCEVKSDLLAMFAMLTAIPASPADDSQVAPFQSRVQPWMLECFGAEIAADRVERNHRFFEEAAELVQACGMTASEAHQLVDYTFGRPVGEAVQETGGVMVTLAALCLANGLDMHAAGETELARIWTKVEKIRAKQAAKPKHSPLPEAAQPVADDTGAKPEPAYSWLPISTAPRDGSNILIRFGRDGASQAKYVPGVPHPWKFIDTNDGITWLINGARDDEYGPSHWMPMPSTTEPEPGTYGVVKTGEAL